MRARHRGGRTYYYLDTGEKPRKEIPLGSDYVLAVQEWSRLTIAKLPKSGEITWRYVKERYMRDVLPHKATRTQADNHHEFKWLDMFFDAEPTALDSIEPIHISQYKRWRTDTAKERAEAKNAKRRKDGQEVLPISAKLGHVRANRELALFSHVWNFAREEGLTNKSNPCTGVSKFKEEGRDVFVDDALLARLLKVAGKPLQHALRLAYLTGQRPADVYKMTESDIRDGVLFVEQGKGKAKLRIQIEGELERLIAEMAEYKRQFKVVPLSLLVTERGAAMNEYTLRTRLDKARADAEIPKHELQFRDMRPKAGTEVDAEKGTRAAQGLLGHTTETMTTTYIRHKVGKLVKPTK